MACGREPQSVVSPVTEDDDSVEAKQIPTTQQADASATNQYKAKASSDDGEKVEVYDELQWMSPRMRVLFQRVDRVLPRVLLLLLALFWLIHHAFFPYDMGDDGCEHVFKILLLHAPDLDAFKTAMLNDSNTVASASTLIAACAIALFVLFSPTEPVSRRTIWLGQTAHALYVCCCVLCTASGAVGVIVGLRRSLMLNLLPAPDVVVLVGSYLRARHMDPFKLAQISFLYLCGAISTLVWTKHGTIYGVAAALFLSMAVSTINTQFAMLEGCYWSTRTGSIQHPSLSCTAMVDYGRALFSTNATLPGL